MKLGYEKPKSNGKVVCSIHFFPEKWAKHLWANCSKNLANQKKLAPQSTVNAHHTAIDNCYLSNDGNSPMKLDHTEAANNQSLDPRSSINYDDAFLTFEALPPPSVSKKAAEKVECSNKSAKNNRKTIVLQQQQQGQCIHPVCLSLSQRPHIALGFLFGKQLTVRASGWYFIIR
jgi:hypothetical protein